MNHAFIGKDFHIDLPASGFLMIADEVPLLPRARYFDCRRHFFNLIRKPNYRKSCDIEDVFRALFVVTGGTLTESTGLDAIAEALEGKPKSLETLIARPDKHSTSGQIWAHGKVQRLMRSPILKPMLTRPSNFSFDPRSTILARINRAELGEFDALAIGLFLMAHFKGQLIVPAFDFYGRDTHATLINEDRLIAGIRSLADLPELLARRVRAIETKTIAGALYDDAVQLAKDAGLRPDPLKDDNPFNEFLDRAMAPQEHPPEPELWVPPELPPEPPKPRAPRVPVLADPYA